MSLISDKDFYLLIQGLNPLKENDFRYQSRNYGSMCGGEGGIRTPGTCKRTIDFESTALDHSATSPNQI